MGCTRADVCTFDPVSLIVAVTSGFIFFSMEGAVGTPLHSWPQVGHRLRTAAPQDPQNFSEPESLNPHSEQNFAIMTPRVMLKQLET